MAAVEEPSPADEEALPAEEAEEASGPVSEENAEEAPPAEEGEETLEEILEADLEPVPEIPEVLPGEEAEEGPDLEAEIARLGKGFYSNHDQELAALIDGLKIFRGIPPAGEKTPGDYVPMLLNRHVEHWLLYFTGKGQKFFEVWLSRLPKYKSLFEDILAQHGVPTDLVYLAMIESGFSPRAYSRAKAVGPWQFIRGTGKLYDLRIDWWVDERRDPIAASHAAARYLKALHDEFGCWYLSAAGYNAGEGKIRRGLAKYKAKSFWELLKHRHLRRETKEYVPKLIAAMILAKAPERFGFVGIPQEAPYEFETVSVPEGTDVALVAKSVGRTYEEIRDLNPHLVRWFTPPEGGDFEIRIPRGTSERFAQNFPDLLRDAPRIQFLTHQVRRGETLAQIAYMYETDSEGIRRLNHIGRTLRAGQSLQVPVRPGTKPRKPPVVLARASRMLRNTDVAVPSGHKEVLHVVGRGDTLWDIAQRFGVTIGQVRHWNRLDRRSRILPGDVVSIMLPASRAASYAELNPVKVKSDTRVASAAKAVSSSSAVRHKVRRGDTGYSIARKYGISFGDLSGWNPKTDWDLLKPGDVVVVYPSH
ncbi:MAG: LysM peptidoglycan-binding domain-containing protein [Bdellovibrionota bacterium]